MNSVPSVHPSKPPGVDWRNVTVGAVVSTLLVALLGLGPFIFLQERTPEEEGVNIGAGMVAFLGGTLAAILGGIFTARRARRRGTGQPWGEGVLAGALGWAAAMTVPPLVLSIIFAPFGSGFILLALVAVLGGMWFIRRRRRGKRPPDHGDRQA